jgi:trimethylamine:corrinoid methyltransferase-like protein
MNMQTAVLSGSTFIHNLGFLSAGQTGSLEMLVLCDELAGNARRIRAGLSLGESALAEQVIIRAARTNSYLMDEHTLIHMREAMRIPSFFQRTSLEDWSQAGSKTARMRIREKLQDLLNS